MSAELFELKEYKNWVAYRLEDVAGKDKPRKIPINPNTGKGAMANNPATWGTYASAVSFATNARSQGARCGIGFEFSNSPFAGIDLDYCFDDNGNLTEWGRDIVETMNSYTEYSPSGRGLHIIFKGEILSELVEAKTQGTKVGNIELYYSGRFFTVTGKHYGKPKPVIEATEGARKIFERYLIQKPRENANKSLPSSTVKEIKVNVAGQNSGDLLEIMFSNPVNGDEIRRLYNGDISGYPSHSEADFALCSHLAFYTGNNAGEIDRIFRKSGLMREKWNENHGGKTYGEKTIENAIAGTNKSYQPYNPLENDSGVDLKNKNAPIAQNTKEANEAENENEARENFKHEAVSYSLNNFMQAVLRNQAGQGISTGFENLDKLLDGGLYAGLYVIGANSSLGKTTFILQMADNIAQAGHGVLIFSLEMATNELIAKTLSRLSLIKSLDGYKSTVYARTTRNVLLGRFYNEYDRKIINQAIQEYSQWGQNIHITEGIGNVGLKQITEKVKEWIKIEGTPPVVVIDYLQILAPYSEKMTDKQNVDRNITELKRLSRDFNIPVIGISSFNRENYFAPVSMASFKESGAIEYSSDVLIGMQYNGYDYQEGETDGARIKRLRCINKAMEQAARDLSSQDIQVKILKNRNGVKGSLLFDFFPAFNYFRGKIEG